MKCPKCGADMARELITLIPYCPVCLYCPDERVKITRIGIKFSRVGRVKYWVLKHVLGIDILELIFGKVRKGRE